MIPLSTFRSSAGEAAYFAEYDAAMKLWPGPYDEMDITNRFGVNHLVASGPRHAPPLVLHGHWATLTMWTPDIAEFSKGHRVYAIDVMGQPGARWSSTVLRDLVTPFVPGCQPVRLAAACCLGRTRDLPLMQGVAWHLHCRQLPTGRCAGRQPPSGKAHRAGPPC